MLLRYGCRHGVKHTKRFSCRKNKGIGVPPCDLENLADAVKLIMRECENAGLFCELQMGTLLGQYSLILTSDISTRQNNEMQ